MKKIIFLFLELFLFQIAVAQTTGWNYNSEDTSKDTVKTIYGKALPKSIISKLGGLKFIEGGVFTFGRISNALPTEKDTTLLAITGLRKVTVSNFFISDHEVTNAEYREFVVWVRDSIARTLLSKTYYDYYWGNYGVLNWDLPINWKDSILLPMFLSDKERFYLPKDIDKNKLIYLQSNGNEINIYPDTLVWINDYPYSYNEPITKHYFWHPAYNDFPVVGVNFQQANAYCDWKTKIINGLLREKFGDFQLPNFRLPSEAEWEYAAIANEGRVDGFAGPPIFPWTAAHFTDKSGKYYANFGQIIDENGLFIKHFIDDGALHTSRIKSYAKNGFNLYDMAGNVSEWVLDDAIQILPFESDQYTPLNGIVFRRKYYKTDLHNFFDGDISSQEDSLANVNNLPSNFVCSSDDVNTMMIKIFLRMKKTNDAVRLDTNNFYDKQKLTRLAKCCMHDYNVLKVMNNPHIVKGGSWADGAIYLISGSKSAFPELKASSKIGFRIAMTYIPQMPINMVKSNKIKKKTYKQNKF